MESLLPSTRLGKRHEAFATLLQWDSVHRIQLYSWVGGDRPEDLAQGALDAAARGFTALMMNGTEELDYIDSFAKIDRVMKNVATVREAVGDDYGIAVDFHGRVHRPC